MMSKQYNKLWIWISPFLNALDSLQGGIEAFTSVLTNTKLLAVAIAGFLVKAIIDFGKAVLEVRNDLGDLPKIRIIC